MEFKNGVGKADGMSEEEVEAKVAVFNLLNSGAPGGKTAAILKGGANELMDAMDTASAPEADIRFAARCSLLVQMTSLLEGCNVLMNLAVDSDIMVACEASLKIMQSIEGAANSLQALCVNYGIDFDLYNLDMEKIAANREIAEEHLVELRARREMRAAAANG